MGWLERLMMGGHHGRGGYGGRHGGGHGSYDAPDWREAPPRPAAAPMTTCAQCQAAIALGAQYCQHCGASQKPTLCSGCGDSLAPQARFCARCGQERST
ncbi:zinc ribbon domain-containing protein [Pseudomonas sp. CAN2814]|uniref:zinc ribbon domain-containing protein n=1 Tax=Pseudomonas sp. CAN1 TaxID=3046726 RepID=UPI002648F68E|nr:zinc ribbon domain-containing protein [Pseudomonas sp. CAN1]MDN6856479.1 zinc ribbon domain-containing protein [Pseudomonas sp. CAN1]